MPNQYNFRSDVTNIIDPRFTASRIIRSTDEGVLLEQIPSSFGYETYDVIELHFYTIPDNILVLSTIIDVENAENILKSHIVTYDDGTFKNYIRIDFTKLFEENNLILVPGDYRMVLNFFSDEIGEYNSRKMYLQQISESGTEVQLAFYPAIDDAERQLNENELREFVEPSFDRPTAIGVDEKIFVSGLRTEDPTEGLTYENITSNIETPLANQTTQNTLDRIARLGNPVVDEFKKNIEDFLPLLYEYIKNEIIIKGDRRIQENEFQEFIERAITAKLPDLQKLVENRIIVN